MTSLDQYEMTVRPRDLNTKYILTKKYFKANRFITFRILSSKINPLYVPERVKGGILWANFMAGSLLFSTGSFHFCGIRDHDLLKTFEIKDKKMGKKRDH